MLHNYSRKLFRDECCETKTQQHVQYICGREGNSTLNCLTQARTSESLKHWFFFKFFFGSQWTSNCAAVLEHRKWNKVNSHLDCEVKSTLWRGGKHLAFKV